MNSINKNRRGVLRMTGLPLQMSGLTVMRSDMQFDLASAHSNPSGNLAPAQTRDAQVDSSRRNRLALSSGLA